MFNMPVRMIFDNEDQHGSRWRTVMSIAAKIGCAPQTLHDWVKKVEIGSSKCAGIPTDTTEKMRRWGGRIAGCAKPTSFFACSSRSGYPARQG